MCGFWGYSGVSVSESLGALEGNVLFHRGPDSEGRWRDEQGGLTLVHRRLSIQDTSSAGEQPMVSSCSRFVIAFNGEIYNHLELRQALQEKGQSPQWQGHSDTETLITCIAQWGIKEALRSLVGMFAFALWDRKEKTLFLARDRVGEKPLYWGWQSGTLLFGSELKALAIHPDFGNQVDRSSLAIYLRHNYIPAPYSIYKGIRKVRPGHFVAITDLRNPQSAQAETYWSANKVIEEGIQTPFPGSDDEAVDELRGLVRRSVKGEMLSDVPIGAFLSGGIDSSLVASVMQEQSTHPIKTFAIGFDDVRYNEAQHASQVARHLGTDHTEMYVSSEDALNVIPALPDIYCEPFADSSQIPTFLVTKMARKNVTVALSGDGGDELFGGYNTYQMAVQYWSSLRKIPRSFRALAASILEKFPLPERIYKLTRVLGASSECDFYRRMVSHWGYPNDVVLDAQEYPSLLNSSRDWPETEGFSQWMMAVEGQMYMPDDILVKVDRAAMANSLETRIPLLDHRLIEFAWTLPNEMKIRGGQGKWILRQLLYGYVPRELIERPKKGFSVPLADWLRGPLREWAEALLSESRLRSEGYFEPRVIRAALLEHMSGQRDHSSRLWGILMFQAWLEKRFA
ncbi:Asparagine synthetase [Marinobacter nitratireducens]|uniref:asparagine synthase (glutamine-hydrolyzing) n=1 Tax=Marinobacter nitratireducens TaxID=1137280 RepID=A0A072N3Y0_9GAMM|nr:asparagine synthase (glutamine-hydrolyzing) [Marinobacter nitratireducens]KEF31663.1 Asparagine synthetase [Marinobacter nitratireducens]